MTNIKYMVFFLMVTLVFQGQVIQKDTTKIGYQLSPEFDSLTNEPIQLEEIYVYKQKADPEARKQFLLLRNRVYKTYPFAKIASERLLTLNKNLANLKTEKEKRKYFKIAEKYMQEEFEEQLKKLSRKQGQILVKLIHRQTGITTFTLIKDYKSGWKAFWSNNTARLFDINLKTKFAPYQVNEDFLIESILVDAFESGRLFNQPPADPVNYDDLYNHWQKLAIKINK